MRLFAYYAFHTVINTIRKLFKTWIAIMAACLVLAGSALAIHFFLR